jgi:steroid delta-isomerase-like uncharacterized protein
MEKKNLALARRWFEEVWNRRRADAVVPLVTPETVGHMESGEVRGVEEFLKVHAEFLTIFPQLQITVEASLAAGDTVVVRWHASATHSGDGLGLKATNKTVNFRGLTWFRFDNGKIMEAWDGWNMGGLIQQLQEGARQ